MATGAAARRDYRKVLVALVFLLLAARADAQDLEKQSIQSDASLYMLARLIALAALAVWEGAKAAVRLCVLPRLERSRRKAEPLRKLQEAVENELVSQLSASSSGLDDLPETSREVPPLPRLARVEERTPVRRAVVDACHGSQSQPASPAPARLLSPGTSSQAYVTSTPPPRTHHLRQRSVPVLHRDAATQADLDEMPRVVVRERVVYPNSVIVTSGRAYHVTAACQAVGRAGSVREAPLCTCCKNECER